MANETQTTEAGAQRAEASPTDAWRSAIASRQTQAATAEGIPSTQAEPLQPDLSRRRFIQASFWTGLGVALLGSVGLFLDYFYPRNVRGFGGPVPAGNAADFPPGAEPKHFRDGQFYIVNLDPEMGGANGSGGGQGLLALWHKCPHLGCTIPWRPGATVAGFSEVDWFQCPCHGSTYSYAGVRVFGPAPRSMDTMLIEIDDAGNVTVQTGAITSGGLDNPTRAVVTPAVPV